ncbi:efflux RND transporter periplasmic adaptor subunit [Geobacter sulfurreducens]|uniref:Efflux pump, RND family, membrane fusion lipoprotein n=1 Tax=Geobacter sulfurreducens (strain ATCC 51573 / DSM 12127 / PCA) TaxID=243231 RepID=Q749S7_GEOSL|nr:efflux RND transporter periplasmic adaptor subunit [Geobacter sulfurreducens]AAR36037.1 efflux pump, RND family, membrane fusion lipoprotein [Geobacter sulfurreducens PCA]ADI85417.2 efflux pump, RND family, membrane fusion lipoprotein [Geobacter sulfurreducens KN400]AJY68959.1 RND transporter [Geobacter sulfurreducens]QVW34488.1 efflux RND transporter periplasmic adaptor subunit [Geobacter sulfurreducens]UAC03362.1 efflux RND transporter periplasmic adaptor subunit [Geobacter sulfurreducens
MTVKWLVCVLGGVLLAGGLAGCSKDGEAQNARVEKPALAVETVPVTARDLAEGIEVTGSLEPKFSADVKTQIPGLVKQVYVTEWVRVRKGAPLARIDTAEPEALTKRAEASVESARAALAQAQVSANRAERELARIIKLKESGLATQQSVDDARTESAAAQARIDAAQAQIRVTQEELRQARARLAKGLVVSPLDGVVALRDVNVGDLAGDAATGKPIFRIVDNRVLNLTVTIPSADSARVKVGQPLEFSVDALPGRIFTGTVMFINPELSAEDRSLRVIAEVRNDGELLKGGLFAKGRILVGRRPAVVQVPRGSLAAWDTASKKASIFVVAGNVAKMKQVETGVVIGDGVEIVKGVGPGEQLVTRGGFNLKDGDVVTVVGKGAAQ